jgi:hypothetical protein
MPMGACAPPPLIFKLKKLPFFLDLIAPFKEKKVFLE